MYKSVMIFRFLLGLFLSTALLSCGVFQDIEVGEVERIAIKDLGKNTLDIDLYIPVSNPNNFDVSLSKSDIDLWVNGYFMGQVELLTPVKVPKKSEGSQCISVRAHSDQIALFLKKEALKLLLNPVVEIEAKGYVKGKARLFSKKVPVSIKESLNLGSR